MTGETPTSGQVCPRCRHAVEYHGPNGCDVEVRDYGDMDCGCRDFLHPGYSATGETPNPLNVLREALGVREWAASITPTDYGREVEAKMPEAFAALAQVEALAEAADELRLWEPGRKGYAAAQDRLFAALVPFATHNTT